jgi:shikimate 5-dehydrogenase
MDITFDVPNLDDASTEFGDYDNLADTLKLLAQYAKNKGDAMYARGAGGITRALDLEAKNERIYRQLPKWARW